ncbi:MAG: hypothetical protein CMQ38_02470 [Gammaproteobacteria bacterium]|nr:hypothetical protein [Gammaproteobacteria bacterium]
MAIEHSIWKVGNKPEKITPLKLDSEDFLEEQIAQDISILNDGWLLIGRQVLTSFNKYIDLLALDASGSLIIIELKRHKTPREVSAQALDYASWADELESNKIAEIYTDFAKKTGLKEPSLDNAFVGRFGTYLSSVDLNGSLQMVIVAAELDASTERIITYLNDKYDVPINAVFFKVFEDSGNRYLSRAWMIDPGETQENAATSSAGEKEPWNGEFYISFGVDHNRDWGDAVRYGFIGAGGGVWYTRTLNQLKEGDRVWVNNPGVGYLGVGVVTGTVVKATDFKVEGKTLSKLDTVVDYSQSFFTDNDDDHAEYIVPVRWIKTVSMQEAVSESGFFGNQNTVAKPKTKKWQHTVERLKALWGVK